MASSLESLFGVFLLVFLLVAIASFMSGNILQGLGALGALFLIGLVWRFFKLVASDKEVSMPSGQQRATQPQPTTAKEEKEVIREVTMIPCQNCGELIPQDAAFCPYCGTRK